MKIRLFVVAIICLLLAQTDARSQAKPLPRFETAVEFTTLGRDAFTGNRTEAGVGGRFTFNLNEAFAIEAAGYFFPNRCFDCTENGRMTQAVTGVKIGKRFNSWGIFGKARPGIVSFSQAEFVPILTGPTINFLRFETKRVTSFATDVGGVIEFYPSPRIVTRFDAGDTIIHFTRRTENFIIFVPGTNQVQLVPFTRPARTVHQFQFNASVGFRF